MARKPKSIEELQTYAVEEWNNVEISTLENLSKSMKSSLHDGIENRGWYAKYYN